MGKRKKKNVEEADADESPEDESREDMLRGNLEDIKTYEGVIGFILRNSTSAAIDLKDPTKIIDYAILSSSAFETSDVLSKDFELGDVKSIIVEGEDVKILSLSIDENRISVFMEKGADCEKVLKKIK